MRAPQDITERTIKMNKQELIASMADKADLTKEQAASALDAFVDSVADSLKAGNEVRILGFGNFTVTHREAKMGRNPQTGKEMEIGAANIARFKVGKGLKDAIN
ncbi:MAG: HU family DNA-binding protein [Pseudomonadota bacterium]